MPCVVGGSGVRSASLAAVQQQQQQLRAQAWRSCPSQQQQRLVKLRHAARAAAASAAAAPTDAAAATTAAASVPPDLILGSVRVVLVAPKTPANIGAVARACANFEAPDLWLVAPRCDPHDGDVAKVAAGAEAVLARLRVVDSLAQALSDTSSSVGLTRRAGATREVHASMADMLLKYPGAIPALDPDQQRQQQQQPVTALVFGREESGLQEEELRLCSHACSIPAGRLQASMNLSHAVAVMLAALFERRLALLGRTDNPGLEVKGLPSAREALQPAAASEVAALLARVSAIAKAAGVSGADSRGGGAQGSHGRRRLPLGHMRAVLARAHVSTWEVRSLHGLAAAVLAKLQGETGDPAALEQGEQPDAASRR